MLGSRIHRQDHIIHDIRQGIADPLDLRQLLLSLITSLSKVLHLENICFHLYSNDSEEFELKESIRLSKTPISIDRESALVHYFESKRDLIVRDQIRKGLITLEKKPNAKKANISMLKHLNDDLEGLQAEIAIPIMVDNRVIGILATGNLQSGRKITAHDLGFIRQFVAEFTPMIQSAITFQELANKEKETNALYEVGKAISSLHDFKKIFDVIARNSSILLKAPKILVILYDDFDANFSIKKSFGFTDFQLDTIQKSVRFKECTQSLSNVLEGILIKSPSENKVYEETILLDLGIHSVLSAPLFDENMTLVGELRAMRPANQKAFASRDLGIAMHLANNIILAINNSSRHQKSEEDYIELNMTYTITKALRSEFALDRILHKVCHIFTHDLNFRRVILYFYKNNNTLIPAIASGWPDDLYKSLTLDINRTIEGKVLIEGRFLQVSPKQLEGFDPTASQLLGLQHFVVLPLLLVNKKPLGVLVVDLGDEPASADNFKPRLLTQIAHQAAVIIENARLYSESELLNDQLRKEQSRTAKELQMAHYIQQGLLSAKSPDHKEVQIFATNIPCRAVGGDFYNFIAYNDDMLGVVVGDVSGKGIPAALLMTMTNSIFKEFGKRFSSPEQILQHTNESLQSFLSKSPLFYVTAFYGMINFQTNMLKYGKAGHNPPILYQAKKDECLMLDAEGTYLGTFDDCGLIEKAIPLENGDKLVLYTDGITEVRNKKKQLFGKERLASFIKTNPTLPAEKLTKFLISEIERWGDNQEFTDDITLVIIDFKDLKPLKEITQYKIDEKIESSLKGIKKCVTGLLKKLEALEINKRVYNHIRLALSEALMNAMEHGNKGDASKSILVNGVITNRRIEVSVKDEGLGFDVSLLRMKENQVDINHRGRGITAINACMDEVRYNEAGTTLTLVKYLEP